MEEEVKQDTSETETQEKRNTEECEETAEASEENTETPEDGETSEEKDKKGFFSGRKKEKKEDAVKAQINELQDKECGRWLSSRTSASAPKRKSLRCSRQAQRA